LLNFGVSEAVLDWSGSVAMMASHKATLDCVRSFSETDFRRDMAAFTMPTLIVHGDADKTVPIAVSGAVAAGMIPDATFVIYEGEPHGLFMTSKDRLNADLVQFLRV
jgi:non-heme chloroperoxidase